MAKPFTILIASNNVNDILPGVYFTVIWASNVALKGLFAAHESFWRRGTSCVASYAIVLFHSVSAQIFLLLLSFSRLRVVVEPMTSKFKDAKYVRRCLGKSSIFLMSIFLVFVGSFHGTLVEEGVPYLLCFPFIDPKNAALSTRFLIWFVFVTQTLTSLTILVFHVLLVYNVQKSHSSAQKSASGHQSSLSLKLQLMFISMATLLCWLPTNIVYLLPLFLSHYPKEVVTWSTVSSYPINSYFVPILFSIVAIKGSLKHRQQEKLKQQKLRDLRC